MTAQERHAAIEKLEEIRVAIWDMTTMTGLRQRELMRATDAISAVITDLRIDFDATHRSVKEA